MERSEIKVYVQSDSGVPFKCGHCMLDKIHTDTGLGTLETQQYDQAILTYEKKDGRIHVGIDTKTEYSDAVQYKLCLEHSDTCPNRIYRQFCEIEGKVPPRYSEKDFKLAVCMALVDSEERVLITKRNPKMKIFPNAWVLPGGHVDPGESLEEAVIRELLEETGVEIYLDQLNRVDYAYFHNKEVVQMEPFYAFESVSMFVKNADNPPSSCHLILFFTIKLSTPAESIKLTLSPGEIDQAAWVPLKSLNSILYHEELPERSLKGLSTEDSMEIEIDLEKLRPPYPNEHFQGISKAHNMALKYMLKVRSSEQASIAKL